jgi:hypothetical protein
MDAIFDWQTTNKTGRQQIARRADFDLLVRNAIRPKVHLPINGLAANRAIVGPRGAREPDEHQRYKQSFQLALHRHDCYRNSLWEEKSRFGDSLFHAKINP